MDFLRPSQRRDAHSDRDAMEGGKPHNEFRRSLNSASAARSKGFLFRLWLGKTAWLYGSLRPFSVRKRAWSLECGVGPSQRKPSQGHGVALRLVTPRPLQHYCVKESCGSCNGHLLAPTTWMGSRPICAHIGGCDRGTR